MKKNINTLLSILIFFIILIIIAILDPSLRPITLGLLNAFSILLGSFITGEDVAKIIILIIIPIAGSALSLRKREQKKLWLILTVILELVSIILFFTK